MSLITDTILEQLNSLIVVVNQSGSVEYVSPSAKRILGFEPEQLLGEGWWNLTRDDAEERLSIKSLALKQLQQESLIETIPYERLLKNATGGDCWVLWNISKSNDNKLVGIGHNITDRKKAEQELLEKNVELLQHNKDMLDSIQYAGRIQEAILPDVQKIKNTFQDAFVLYQPKDVVSGDYYFFYQKENKAIVVAVDCTGHGVPGAFMSIVGHNLLDKIVGEYHVTSPAEILNYLNKGVSETLRQSAEQTNIKDGMDISLCVFNTQTKVLEFAGAYNPLYIVSQHNIEGVEVNMESETGLKLYEVKAGRFSIGNYTDEVKQFTNHFFNLNEGDTVYLFSDGYAYQFGGAHGKKFRYKQFKELLLAINTRTMEEQKEILQKTFTEWKGSLEQIDDVIIIGSRVE